ncbi:MAG TPA: hypothetical protein VKB88_29055 [Bryobacteraceae bacterium]|nr:hypothetical protein [Bryobacteraceae bacterium]
MLKVTTPLGEDALVLTALSGREAISGLFHFRLETIWQDSKPLDFKRLLGQTITVELARHGPGDKNATVNPRPSGVSADVVAFGTLLLVSMLICTLGLNEPIGKPPALPTVASQDVKLTGTKSARGKTPELVEGASTIHSADDSSACGIFELVLKPTPSVSLCRVSVNVPFAP